MKILRLSVMALLCVEVWAMQKPTDKFDWKHVTAVAVADYRTGCDKASRVKFTVVDRNDVYEIVNSFFDKPRNLESCGCMPTEFIFLKDDKEHLLSGRIVAGYIVVGDNWKQAYPVSQKAEAVIREHRQTACIED